MTNDPVRVISRIKNNRLLKLWEESGLSTEEFSKQLGISTSTWYQLTALKVYPSIKTANKISEATGLSADELFPGILKKISKTVAVHTIPEHDLIQLSSMPERALLTDGGQEAEVYRGELRSRIRKSFNTLTHREQMVVEMRFGIDDGQERTFEEIANILGVTRERVRQLEAKALFKLRCYSGATKDLRDFIHPDNRAAEDRASIVRKMEGDSKCKLPE